MAMKPSLFNRIMKAMGVPDKKVKPYDARTFIGPEKPIGYSYERGLGKHQDLDDILYLQGDEGYFSRWHNEDGTPKDDYYTRYKEMEHGRVPESMKKKAVWSVNPKVAKKLGIETPDADVIKYGDRWLAPQYQLTPIGRRNMEYQYDAGVLNDFRKEQKANIDFMKNHGISDEEIIRSYKLDPKDI